MLTTVLVEHSGWKKSCETTTRSSNNFKELKQKIGKYFEYMAIYKTKFI